ncbi:MAG: tail fiber domain-containing protein [Bacteroidetes bacterium]|nr:tail fiber domain-containing protein [Bacteroidota bacterium]
MKIIKYRLLSIHFVFILNLLGYSIFAQSVPQGINYQGLARDNAGLIIANQIVAVKVGIFAPSVTGVLEWEETHLISTNTMGLFYFVIGQGNSTGAGSVASFSEINWGANTHFVKIGLDPSGGNAYLDVDTVQFWAVPYAMHAGVTDSLIHPMRLSQLLDVDTVGVFTGSVLKWDGVKWKPSVDNDSDTALYSINSFHSTTSDTAYYAVNVLSAIDTIPFSFYSDSAQYSINSGTASTAGNSNYCDTALYAFNSATSNNYWKINGNSGTSPLVNFIGTIDNKDLVFKTNSLERMRITSSGKLGIGITTPSAALHVVGNDGIVAEGNYGSGVSAPSGAGTRLVWNPKKAAFRVGSVTGSQWNDANMGAFSFASGYDTRASGAYSTVFGSSSIASGVYSLAGCQASTASGIASIALGSACIASGPYSVALARGTLASDSNCVSIGYHCEATAKYAVAIGYQTRASGMYSTAIGYYANANGYSGGFIWADGSSPVYTMATANNQFMARASGGVVFYSNNALTSGVSLAPGGGSWASVSDKNKKEKFKNVDVNDVLNKLSELEITTWNYKTQSPSIRHIGPMAQDFYKLFSFGDSDTTITTIDVDGISLAAIQALAKKTDELKLKAAEVEKLKLQLSKLQAENALLEKRIVIMEKKLLFTSPAVTTSVLSK